MTNERRTGGRRTKSARGGGTIPQLPWTRIVNPHAPLELANEEQIEAIHDTSMRVLSELGIRVMGARVMDLFEAAGAIVDRSEKVIRIDESLVAEALKTVPSSFTLTSRNPAKRLTIGGPSLAFGLVAGPPNVHDRVNGRRPGNLGDYQNFIRLAHYFNADPSHRQSGDGAPGTAGELPPSRLLPRQPDALGPDLPLHRDRARPGRSTGST